MMINEGDHSVIRLWATSNGYGDVYFDGVVPKVQLHGNALLVVAFMIDFYKKRKFDCINVILLLGIIVAGNFAFKMGFIMFFSWLGWREFFHKITIKKLVLIFMSVVMLTMFIQYTGEEAEKKSGYNSSNAVRIAQLDVLTDTNEITGFGLGALVKDSRINHGKLDNRYFEVQTLYVYYQIGAICLIMYYCLLFSLMRYRIFKDGQILLAIYLIYSFFNPYCFDTTEMLTIIFLASLSKTEAPLK